MSNRPELKAIHSTLKSFGEFENDEQLIGFCLDCVVVGQSAIDCITRTGLFEKLSYPNQSKIFQIVAAYNDKVSDTVYDISDIFKAEGYEV